MKKPITVACVFLLLAVIIGYQRFDNGIRIEQQTKPRELTALNQQVEQSQVPAPHLGSSTLERIPFESTLATDLAPSPNRIDSARGQAPKTALNSGSGERSAEIRYIRGQIILGTEKPSEKSVSRLREAIKQVASKMNSSIVVFDTDGLATSTSPFLLFANPEFDLTKLVESAYRELETIDKASTPTKENEPIVPNSTVRPIIK